MSISPADAVVPRLLTVVDQRKLQILQNQGFAAGLFSGQQQGAVKREED